MTNKENIMNEREEFRARVLAIAEEVTLAPNFGIRIGEDEGLFDAEGNPAGRFFYQISLYRMDVITKEMSTGYGGKAYLSQYQTDNELVQTIFGLYKGFWEHEARETFQWRERRVFGPHIATDALWEVAKRVDVRSAKHVEDTPKEIS